MYDVHVALRRFRGLIRWTARKYSVPGDVRLSRSDLEAEGLLVLVKCCRAFPENQTRFARYFKRAWYNHLKMMFRDSHRKKRTGFVVDLLDAESVPQIAERDWVNEQMTVLHSRLSSTAYQFLQLLVSPTEEVVTCAWVDFCRKSKLRSLGIRSSGSRKFRIKAVHVRRALAMSGTEAENVLREIRHVGKTLHDRRNVDVYRKEETS